jgi:hypothetical protein|tara:strand:- start:1413 stop:1862 length:450 start_codon:yes stop_codon:yes gene_type:complete
MATTTASLSIESSDLVGDALSLSTTKELYKAGTTVGLEETTGMAYIYLTATTSLDIFPVLPASPAGQNKQSWVYICNKATDETHYITVTIAATEIGRLYAGDFLFMPWSQIAQHADIEIAPSTEAAAAGINVEYTCLHEGLTLPTSADS